MNYQKTTLFLVLLTLCYMHSSAQDNKIFNEPDHNKPKAFADLPAKLKLQLTDMDALLKLPVGASVNTVAAVNLHIIGTVVSVSGPIDPSVKSVVIKMSNRGGATFTFTKVIHEDGTYTYRGRIMNMKNIDALEIVKENGNYILSKTGLYDLYSE